MPFTSHSHLETWNAIAEFLGVTVRTAQLWERNHALPIHRLPGPSSVVFTTAAELLNWKDNNPGPDESEPDALQPSQELDGWKAIAFNLKVPIRTAQLWEHTRGLPVHRLPGSKGRVFSTVTELKTWKWSRNGRGFTKLEAGSTADRWQFEYKAEKLWAKAEQDRAALARSPFWAGHTPEKDSDEFS